MEEEKSCQFRRVHCHFILPLKCYNGLDVLRNTGPGSGVVSAGY